MSGLTYRAKQNKIYKWRKANGITIFQDAAPVRAHIEYLKSLGLTDSMIAYASDCDPQNIALIVTGTTKSMWIENAQKILAVTHVPDPRQHYVPTIGARRRVRALNAIGWPTGIIANRLGLASNIRVNVSINGRVTEYSRWAAIRDLYDELSGTPGPATRIIHVAKRNHYAPPLAWEGLDIDDPRVQPDWAAMGIKLTERPMCIRNHAYTPQNTYYDNRGNRQCKTCRKAANDRRRAKRIAAKNAA